MIRKIFFTSDNHFGHENIIKHDRRSFNTVEEMDRELIKRWNNKVSENDTVFSLGDMFWRGQDYAENILKQLNGSIHLIKGNHCHRWLGNTKHKPYIKSIKDFDDIKVTLQNGEIKRCMLSHYFMPFYNSHYYGAIHLHGHSHNSKEHFEELRIAKELNEKGFVNQIYNVGCMLWNYEPVTLDEILGNEKRSNKRTV